MIRVLVICDAPGQLCNRLWAATSWIGFARSNDLTCIWLGFFPYCKNFPLLKSIKKLYILKLMPLIPGRVAVYISKAFVAISRLALKIDDGKGISSFVFTEKSISDFLRSKNACICLVESWPSVKPNDQNYYSIIKEYFDPCVGSDQSILGCGSEFDVGIHIRKGDYKNFKNGMYDYPLEFYIEIVNRMLSFFVNNPPVIYLASNSVYYIKAIIDNFPDVEFHYSDSDPYADLCMLSRSKLIIGPPSSFSAWASFHSDIPIHFVTPESIMFTKRDFKLIQSNDIMIELRNRLGEWS